VDSASANKGSNSTLWEAIRAALRSFDQQKRLRPFRSDGGSCEKGAPSSGEKIDLDDCSAVKGTDSEINCQQEAVVVRQARL